MNVMLLDYDHVQRARMHPDNYTYKLTTEAVQLLNGALYEHDVGHLAFYNDCHDHTWKDWASESVSNWSWLLDHAHALGREFDRRYPDSDSHSSIQEIEDEWDSSVLAEIGDVLPDGQMTEFPQTMKDFEPEATDPVEAYREYVAQIKAPEDWCEWSCGYTDWIEKYQ